MRKQFCYLLTFLYILITLAGCNDKNNEKVSLLLSNTSSIKITDVGSNMYCEPLQILLNDYEVSELIGALNNAPEKNTSFTGCLYYSFELYDKNNLLIDRITTDTQKTIKFDSGIILQRDSALDAVIKSIEQNHNISVNIWDRKPDTNYFSMMYMVEHGLLYEITENNFVNGIHVTIDKNGCDLIAKQMLDPSFSDEAVLDFKKKYILELYTADGGIVYHLNLADNGDIYTDSGYRIKCDALKSTVLSFVN